MKTLIKRCQEITVAVEHISEFVKLSMRLPLITMREIKHEAQRHFD